MEQQIRIPCCLMRGGTSKGPFFNQADLPADIKQRNKVLLAAMGSPDKRQIDGLGGAHPLTSKVGIVAKCEANTQGAELSFLFAQLQPDNSTVNTEPNCGNMLAAVVPYALETGLITAHQGETTVRVLTENTGMLSDITIQTPNGQITYEGSCKIDGVPGTSAPIKISFLDTAGSVCSSLLPTGNYADTFDIPNIGKLEVTCIDNGMPMILIKATDLNCTGQESVTELNENKTLKEQLETLRLKASEKMGLGDVSQKNYPKMCLLSEATQGGAINTRCFIPHVCHDAIGVLAAVTVATACVLPNTVATKIYQPAINQKTHHQLSIEHPSGEFSVELEVAVDSQGNPAVQKAALLRTARLIMQGEICLLASRVQAK
ncbi:4-oxalomesaconate tautomerase [Entomomonas sp. E2T0]|uniref:4-oxalomesaconate tautomerase n=1 Tax=Entomomonas sp. E2T0 TaxID=2930213 RepID=UPI00222848EC|nr:4-oxalomesaconate tautomerase [Entomomonas sp. E2T0]UYZ83932.1 4-oxalomesaconate tautomerase [Entomomonas sp. E2T0]